MVTIHLAYTAAVNPAGAAPVLTQAQVFAGFQRKVRRPWEFVPAIESSTVLSDADGVVTRRVTFKAAGGVSGQAQEAVEVCTEHAPSRMDYRLENGSSVLNVISSGPSGAADDLFVTYVFAWVHEDLAAGSAEALAAEEQHKKVAKAAVDSSIATTRRLAAGGQI